MSLPASRSPVRLSVFLAIGLLGWLLVWPSLRAGFFADDYLQLAAVEGWSPHQAGPLDLYRFIPSNPDETRSLVALGVYPWWSAPELSMGFWRPLSSALLLADHTLFGRVPLPYHVHTLLWTAGLLAAVGWLFARHLPGKVAPLAFAIFAIDDAHAMTASWIAARHAAVAALPVVLGLLAHLRFRQRGWSWGAWLGPLGFAVGLTGGETAVATVVYLFAWELAERRRGWRQALAPYLALLLIYFVVQRLVHAGTSGSGGYLDPRSNPGAFLTALPLRLGVLLGNLGWGLPADLLLFRPGLQLPLAAAGVAFVAMILFLWRRVNPGLDDDERAALRFLAPAVVISLALSAASLPGERVLLPASIGSAAIFAILLRAGWQRLRDLHGQSGRTKAGTVAALALLALPNLLLAPVARAAKSATFGKIGAHIETVAMNSELAGERPIDVVVLHCEDLGAGYLALVRVWKEGVPVSELRAAANALHAGKPLVRPPANLNSYRVLSMAATSHLVRRTDAHTLELHTPDGTLLDGGWPPLFRAPWIPLGARSVIQLGGLRVTIIGDRNGLPTRAAFRFDRSLDDPALRLLVFRDGAFRRFTPPPLGVSAPLDRGPPLLPP